MASAETTEIDSDKDELASLELIEKIDPEKSSQSAGNVDLNFVNKDQESSESICKTVEDLLLADVKDDSDNQDDEIELRWEDDDDEIKNEEALLEGTDSPQHPLTLQEEVIKTIEAEEKLLESENECKSQSESISDSGFVPKMEHNLNKPDMMLEIPSHELIEFSDDEDMTNNLEMSPDIDTDEETSILNEVDETQADVHIEEIVQDPPKKDRTQQILDEKALENEAKLAADILTKELNTMDTDSNITTEDIDKEINEVIKEDVIQEELVQIEKAEESMKDIQLEEVLGEEIQENLQDMENEITGLCEEIISSVTGSQTSEVKENITIKSEAPDIAETDVNIEKSDLTAKVIEKDTSLIENDATNIIEESTLETISDILEPTIDNTSPHTSDQDEIIDTNVQKVSIEKSEEKMDYDESLIDTESDPQPSTLTEPEILQKDQDINKEPINSKEKIATEVKETQSSIVDKEKSIDSNTNEPMIETETRSDKPQINTPASLEINDPLPSTSNTNLESKISPIPKEPISASEEKVEQLTLPNEPNEIETIVNLPTHTNDPQPSTSKEILKALDDTIEVDKPSHSMDIDPQPSTSKEFTVMNDPIQSETRIDKPVHIIDPKPSTSKEISTTLNESETMIDKPVHSIEPQPSTSKAIRTTLDDPNQSETMIDNKTSKESMFGIEETSNDVPEMTDSLGLLAESSRVMEDDEEPEYDDDNEDEDDFDQDQDDESSNQVSAEHSEDSNAQHSESDVQKDSHTDKNFTFTIADVASEVPPEAMECDEIEQTEKPSDENETENDLQKDSATQEKQSEPMEIETVKLSDTSDTEVDTETGETILKALLSQGCDNQSTETQSPIKTKNLEIVKQNTNKIFSFVDLEGSSSEDDVQDAKKSQATESKPETTDDKPSDVNIDKNDDIKNDENEVDELQKSSPSKSKPPEVAEETKPSSDGDSAVVDKESVPKTSAGLEVFNLDSDEEEPKTKEEKPPEDSIELKTESVKCINKLCSSDANIGYYIADKEAIKFYDADKKKRGFVCQNCADAVEKRNQELINGIKNFAPLLELGNNRSCEDLVEISDSESEDEAELDQEQVLTIGTEGAKVAEEKLADLINETWEKFKMDARLVDTQNTLQKEMERLQKESAEINELLNECQVATDQLRNELYATFEPEIRELPPFVIYDMPNCTYACVEPSTAREFPPKRGRSPSKEIPAKRPAIPLGYAPLDDKSNDESKNIKVTSEKAEDDNTDVSVVKLSAEAAPKDLPPPGEITLTPVKVGMTVYAMKNAFGSWLKAKVVEILPKPANSTFTLCRVKFEHKVSKNPFKILPARCLAYYEQPEVRLTIGRRVIALFQDSGKREAYYSGIVAEIPNPVNSYRYLIFFDDGYAQYAYHSETRLVCECSCLVWEEVHPYSREFVRQYLFAYPERPMVRLHAGQNLKTEWRGKWWSSRVVRVDASLVQVQFLRRERREWIYRGSTRLAPLYLELQAAERHRPRAVPRAQPQARTNMPYVEYTRSDEQASKAPEPPQQTQQQIQQQQQQNEEMRRQRAVAKKSTTMVQPPVQPASDNLDNVTSRVVYYTPKNAVKPYKMVPHTCSPKCKRTDVLALKDLRTYNPLAKPLLSGWERQIVRWKGQRAVLYVAPCGRRIRDVRELHMYLRSIRSDMPVDLFDFSPATHCLAEFVLNKCFVGKKDLSHGKENVPVPCVNYYDESLPEFCSYNTERTPTAGVPLNLDPDFLCGCDCEDDCEDKTKCACWKMTLEGARTIGLEGDNVGYVYKRLPEPLPSGIYECNSRCKCKHTCLNRVAQHPLQLKLQVFKTLNRGWGIRALNDVPKGAFLCVYAGNLLTDATANLDGLNEGDEYLAELDYIEVVEQMKEGYEEDIPEKIKKLDQKESEQQASEDTEEEEQSSEDEASNNKTDLEDDDFQPGYIGLGVAEFNKRLRKRDSKKQKGEKEKEEGNQKEKDGEKKEGDKENNDEECITISDDEEVREPSCFTAAAGMGANEFISKYRSVRTLFGEDEACYIMDAKVQGNIGRYLNHSCSPNVFVQNVFVDTHDPRFPWVAFFALSHIRAGTELTWNYNYDVGSVPGKVLYCHCGASNCRGRLL